MTALYFRDRVMLRTRCVITSKKSLISAFHKKNQSKTNTIIFEVPTLDFMNRLKQKKKQQQLMH